MRWLMMLLAHWLPFAAASNDDERLRSLERRVAALDATVGALDARRTRERHARDTERTNAIR